MERLNFPRVVGATTSDRSLGKTISGPPYSRRAFSVCGLDESGLPWQTRRDNILLALKLFTSDQTQSGIQGPAEPEPRFRQAKARGASMVRLRFDSG